MKILIDEVGGGYDGTEDDDGVVCDENVGT